MKITYEDKVKLQDEPDIPNKNKVTDNDMNEIKDVVNTNADELDTAKENIENLEEGQGTNSTDITNLKGRMTTLETDNTKNKSNISNLQKDNETNKTNISNLRNSKVDKIEGKGLSTEDFTTQLKTKLEGLENYNDTEIQEKIQTIEGKVQTLEDDNASNKTNISTLQGKVTNLEKDNTDNKSNITNLQKDVDNLGGEIEANKTNIQTLKAENEQLKEEVESYKNSLPRETLEGEYITMQNTADKVKFKDFILGGNSKQEAEPSPEFPSKIENVYAKNLVSGKWTNGLLNADGDLSNADQNLYRHFRKKLKAGTYTYSYSPIKGYLTEIRAVNLTTKTNLTVTNKTFTLEEDAEISLGFRKKDSTEWDIGENLEDIRFMLEEGEVETDYIQSGVVVTNTNRNLANISEIYMNMKSYSPGNCVEETVDGRDCIRFANSRFRPDVENPFNLISYKYKEKTAYTFRILAKAGEQPEGAGGSGSLTFQAVYTDGTKVSASKTKADATSFVELRFVTDPEKTIARVGFNYGTSCQWYMDKSSIFIAEGDTTDYVANEQQQVVFPLEQGQKLMLGDYLDDDGIHHVRKQVELNGTEDITINHAENNVFKINNILDIGNNGSTQDIFGYYCTHFKEKTHVQVRAGSIGFCALGEGVNAIYLGFGAESTVNSIENCKTYLAEQKQAGTPVIVEYKLLEEETEEYTEEQQEADNKLKELTTYAGQTNIYSTNNIKPVFTVTGIKDVNSLITQVNQLILEGGN